MPLIDRLESRLGRFAIPGLIQFIAGLQLFALALFMFLAPDARQPFEELLLLKPDALLRGELWRLFSYVFIPNSSPFFAIIGALFMMWLGRGLDEAWGAFRVNFYVIGGMFSLALGAVLFGFEANAMWFYIPALFAFASFYPNEEILLFFILPVKIKYVAWFTTGMLLLSVISNPFMVIPVFFSLLNYLVAFGPSYLRQHLHQTKITQRRAQFEESVSADFFHRCKSCGKTEKDDPTLDFRVTDDGDEICSACRKVD